jgi:hypothetical protein
MHGLTAAQRGAMFKYRFIRNVPEHEKSIVVTEGDLFVVNLDVAIVQIQRMMANFKPYTDFEPTAALILNVAGHELWCKSFDADRAGPEDAQ